MWKGKNEKKKKRTKQRVSTAGKIGMGEGVRGFGGGGWVGGVYARESFSYNAPRVWFSASLCIYKTQNENHSNNQVHDIL